MQQCRFSGAMGWTVQSTVFAVAPVTSRPKKFQAPFSAVASVMYWPEWRRTLFPLFPQRL
eukprot:11217761-Lingulodinium_polyedra.AAC.1